MYEQGTIETKTMWLTTNADSFCQAVGEVPLFPTASNYNINLPSCLKDFRICGSKCSEYLKTNADI